MNAHRKALAPRLVALIGLALGLALGAVTVLAETPTATGAAGDSAGTPAPPETALTKAASPAETAAPARQILAYYFHTTKRCVSCKKIEAYTTEAMQTGFGPELKDGRLVFRVVNVDEPANQHFLKDYKLFTKSVVLVEQISGEESSWKNLPKVWELLNDKAAFEKYIQEETRAFLAAKQS